LGWEKISWDLVEIEETWWRTTRNLFRTWSGRISGQQNEDIANSFMKTMCVNA
jgi:hypothetical protein